MDYKQLPEYKELLSLGLEDITEDYGSRRPVVAFWFKNHEDDPIGHKYKRVKYVIQKSGYIRRIPLKVYQSGKEVWDSSGIKIEIFQPGRDDFKEVGIKLLLMRLKISLGLMKSKDTFKLRWDLVKPNYPIYPERDLIINYFEREWLRRKILSVFEMISNLKKRYQGYLNFIKIFRSDYY